MSLIMDTPGPPDFDRFDLFFRTLVLKKCKSLDLDLVLPLLT